MADKQSYQRAFAYAAIVLGVLIMIWALALCVSNAVSHFEDERPMLVRVWVFVATLGAFVYGMGKLGLRRLAHHNAREGTRIAVTEAALYTERDSRSPVVALLAEGDAVTAWPLTEIDGVDWTRLTLADGRAGFVIGQAPICTVLTARMVDETIVRKDSPTGPEQVVRRGDDLEIAKNDWDDAVVGQVTYVRAWLPNGERVYVKNNTRLRWS